MSLKSILHDVGAWFTKAFKTVRDDADRIAITITQNLKLASDSGLLKVLTDLIPGTLDDKILQFLQNALPKALAVELALQGLPDNPTPEQVKEFIDLVISKLASKNWQDQSKFYTSLSVNLYNQIEQDFNNHPDNANLSFAEVVSIIESAYAQIKAHQDALAIVRGGGTQDTNPDA